MEDQSELEPNIGDLSAEQIESLKQNKGAIVVVPVHGKAYAFAAPSEGQWFVCFNDMQDAKKNTALAMKTLVLQCVRTSREDLDELIKSRPPVVQKFFAEIVEASGLDDSSAKKL
jgi:hypothetical protein